MPATLPSKTGVQFFAGVPLNKNLKCTNNILYLKKKEAGIVKNR